MNINSGEALQQKGHARVAFLIFTNAEITPLTVTADPLTFEKLTAKPKLNSEA